MKYHIERTDGKDIGNTYLVVNTDEPYAGRVADMIETCERTKGTWDHADQSLREVMGISGQFEHDIGFQLAEAQADNAKLRAELLKGVARHWSDCALHNMPAEPNGPCSCIPILQTNEIIQADNAKMLEQLWFCWNTGYCEFLEDNIFRSAHPGDSIRKELEQLRISDASKERYTAELYNRAKEAEAELEQLRKVRDAAETFFKNSEVFKTSIGNIRSANDRLLSELEQALAKAKAVE